MADSTAETVGDNREGIVALLVEIQNELDRTGQLLAAVRVSQAIDCLDPCNLIDLPFAHGVH